MTALPRSVVAYDPAAPWWQQRAGWLYNALSSGVLPDYATKDVKKQDYEVSLEAIGSLDFPDGGLVVADPYLMEESPRAIVQRLRPESYAVVIARALIEPGHKRIAAAMLVGPPREVCAWQMAHWTGQQVRSLTRDEFFGYGVDAGTGCFASEQAAAIAGLVLGEDEGMLEDPISQALFSDTAQGAVVVAPDANSPEIAVFTSGWGDGCYPTWLGTDAAGTVVVAVTDFLLTGDPHATVEPPKDPATPTATHRPSLLRRLLRR